MAQKGFNKNLHSKLHPVFRNTVAIFRQQWGTSIEYFTCAILGTYVSYLI